MACANINGTNIYYEVKGDPSSDKAVAFLNGVMASTNSWSFQVPVFEKLGYKIILHDFRGQLMSDKPKGPYTFAQHVEDVVALFDFLGVDSAHLIGTSYGGEVAMKMAIEAPERVRTISIIDSVTELDEVLRHFITSWIRLAEKKNARDFFWGMLPSIYGNQFVQDHRAMLTERAEALATIAQDYFDGQIWLYETFLNDVQMTQDLHKIQCPTLVVVGEQDILKPPKFSRIIADEIPGAEYAVFPDCGHVTIFEKPNVLNSVLLGFVIKHS